MIPRLPYLVFFCAAVFLVDMFLIHFIKPELNWTSETLSQYALGDGGYIINVGFYSFAIAQFVWAASLVLQNRMPVIHVPLLFFLAGSGAFLVATFAVQPDSAEMTTRLPHIAGAVMQFMFFPLALMGIKNFIQDGRAKHYTQLTAHITFLLFVIILILFIFKSTPEFQFFGLIEKINILFITLWMVIFPFVSVRSNVFKALTPAVSKVLTPE